jgi:hypothetical protein
VFDETKLGENWEAHCTPMFPAAQGKLRPLPVGRLKQNEGVDFWTADQSLRDCTRLASFFLLCMLHQHRFPRNIGCLLH